MGSQGQPLSLRFGGAVGRFERGEVSTGLVGIRPVALAVCGQQPAQDEQAEDGPRLQVEGLEDGQWVHDWS